MTKNILLILTGGTICSAKDENKEQTANVAKAQRLIVANFRNSNSKYRDKSSVYFDMEFPLNILSENITAVHWNTLISEMSKYDFSKYDGVIILHGTDTLAYTSSLLSILLAGIKIPVVLVSSQLPLYDKKTNGNANFKTAIELILNGLKPNVYVLYRNCEIINGEEKNTMYIHYGAHLRQCENHSSNFYSNDMVEIDEENPVFDGIACENEEMMLYSVKELKSCVLRIMPYVGMDYEFYSLENVKAVMHGTYHSDTVCINPYGDETSTTHSILYLQNKCREKGIPFFVEPCEDRAYKYETTGKLLRSGAIPLWGTTSEMAYVKLLIACSMDMNEDEAKEFIEKDINYEKIFS